MPNSRPYCRRRARLCKNWCNGFIVPLDGAPDVFLHLRDLEPGVAEALEELAVVSYDVVPYRDKTKAVRLQVVDAAAYAQLVLENQGRTLPSKTRPLNWVVYAPFPSLRAPARIRGSKVSTTITYTRSAADFR